MLRSVITDLYNEEPDIETIKHKDGADIEVYNQAVDMFDEAFKVYEKMGLKPLDGVKLAVSLMLSFGVLLGLTYLTVVVSLLT